MSAEQVEKRFHRAMSELQNEMAMHDLLGASRGSRTLGAELLLIKQKKLALRMDGNKNHPRAHIHIDYHRDHHLASYAIDTGERLAGAGTYDRVVTPWIGRHRADLMIVWNGIRGSGPDSVTVALLNQSDI